MAYTRSFDKNKMALARTYSIPGPKMIFLGDERADLTPFRFFREFDSVKNEDYLYVEKGYKPGKPALQESTFGNIKYSSNGRTMMNKFRNLTRDLNSINAENTIKEMKVLTDVRVETADGFKNFKVKESQSENLIKLYNEMKTLLSN